MNEENVYVAFTMDCERITKESKCGGPETWEQAERNTSAYAEALKDGGMTATFFVHPANAQEQRDLFLGLEKEGFELGMHIHVQSHRDCYKMTYERDSIPQLGWHTYEDQLRILGEAKQDWVQGFDREPESFRPGYCSANDYTFRVLEELGFKQGSVSIPERWAVRWRAVWVGMYRTAHHANPANRLIPGNLNFVEVPVTVDWEKRWPTPNSVLPQEFALERGVADVHKTTIEKNIIDMINQGRSYNRKYQLPSEEKYLKTLCSFSHNYVDFTKGPHKKTLLDVIDYLWKVGDKYGLKIIPSTIEQIHKAYDTM